jgi:diacylglycerol kinase (ATP)
MYYYIINPAAGRGAVNQIQDRLRAKLQELGISGEFAKTTGTGDASKMTSSAIAKGYNTIVAIGGDDTVNEVINGITKDSVAVGIVPIGTSNTLAKQLGIRNWLHSTEVLAARRITSYNLIAAGQKFFLSSLTLGFETDLGKQVDQSQAGIKGAFKRFGQAWGTAQQFSPLQAKLSIDDQLELECQLFSLTIGNQKFENPLADNRLIIRLQDEASATNYFWRRLRHGSALEETATTRLAASRVVVNTTPSASIMVDGKVAGRTPIAIRLTDRRIRFITEKPSNNLQS